MSYARIFIKVPNELYFSTERFLRGPYDMWKGQMFTDQGKDVPLYIESHDDIPQCHPGNPSDYKRTRKGWTVSIPYFDIEFPSHAGSVELYAKNAVSTLASNYTSESECGANFAAWLKINKPNLYARETGQDSNNRKLTHEQFVNQLQTKLVKAFEKNHLIGMYHSMLGSHTVISRNG